MKKQNIIKATIFMIILCCFNLTIAADGQDAIQNQFDQLENIEKQIDTEQQLIEKRYEQQIEALLKYTEDRAKKLKSSYRMLWIKYYDMMKDAPAKDNYFFYSRLWPQASLTTPKINILREKMINSYSLYNAWTLLLDENAREFVAHIANNSNYGNSISLLRSQAREVLKIMNNLQSQLSRHQQYRLRALANLEEKKLVLKRDVLTEVTPAQKQSSGILNATAHVDGKWLAMVDDKVLYEGDTINNVNILEINNKQVKFSKNGQAWTQKLGENKETLWQ